MCVHIHINIRYVYIYIYIWVMRLGFRVQGEIPRGHIEIAREAPGKKVYIYICRLTYALYK